MKKLADRIAESILAKSPEVLGNSDSSGWWIDLSKRQEAMKNRVAEYSKVNVGFGKDARVVVRCDLADSDELQVIGLQRHASLNDGDGMAFPYDPPRKVSFHMADVSFPIDIVFVGTDSRVSKIVENAEPGTKEIWTMPHTALVVEVPGGYCNDNGISVGDDVYEVDDGFDVNAQETFDTERTRRDINPKMQPDVVTYHNFKDRDMVDVVTENQPMDNNYDQTQGYDVTKDQSEEVSPVRPSR